VANLSKIAIGFGSGRCGTHSFAAILAKQPCVLASHEASPLKWEFDTAEFYRSLVNLSMLPQVQKFPDDALYIDTIDMIDSHDWIQEELEENIKKMFEFFPDKIVCDVAWSWLNYIDTIMRIFPDAKAVCIKRDMAGTIKSWNHVAKGANFWTKRKCQYWDGLTSANKPYYPQYYAPKELALQQYWLEYYGMAECLAERHPENVKIVSIDVNNDADLQHEVLNFIGVPWGEHVIRTDFKLGRSSYAKYSPHEGVKAVPFNFNHKLLDDNKKFEFMMV